MERSQQVEWTRAENKVFESGLAIYGEKRWAKVAAMIPGKTVWDVMRHYKDLEHDVSNIEAGIVDSSFHYKNDTTIIRKKGLPWTKDEHSRFLLGLMKHGKGDWRNISRNFVPTKTPTQVASHAQKYFLRQIGVNNKRRPSIHDFTTTNLFLNLNQHQPTPNNLRSLQYI